MAGMITWTKWYAGPGTDVFAKEDADDLVELFKSTGKANLPGWKKFPDQASRLKFLNDKVGIGWFRIRVGTHDATAKSVAIMYHKLNHMAGCGNRWSIDAGIDPAVLAHANDNANFSGLAKALCDQLLEDADPKSMVGKLGKNPQLVIYDDIYTGDKSGKQPDTERKNTLIGLFGLAAESEFRANPKWTFVEEPNKVKVPKGAAGKKIPGWGRDADPSVPGSKDDDYCIRTILEPA